MVRRLTAILCGVLLLNGFSPSRQTVSNAPYFYYFANNAFIVERADGTDTHVIGGSRMAQTYKDAKGYETDGPGWSPSGNWFAWTFAYGNTNATPYKPHVVSIDGSRWVTVLDTLQHAQLAWAPHCDLLAVAGATLPASSTFVGPVQIWLALVDPNTNRVIVSTRFTIGTFGGPWFPANITWLDDMHAVIAYNGADNTGYTHGIILLGTDGTIINIPAVDVLLSGAQLYYSPPAVSTNGNILRLNASELSIKNILSRQSHKLGVVADPDILEWSPDGRYALLFGTGIWLITTQTDTLEPILPTYIGYSDDTGTTPLWAPDSQHALFISDKKLYELDAAHSTLSVLSIPTTHIQWYWTTASNIVVGSEAAGDEMTSYAIYALDLNKGTGFNQPLIGQHPLLSDFSFRLTPDNQKLAYMQDGPVIYDVASRTTHYISPAANSYNSFSGGEVSWDPTGQWLLTFDNAVVAGGCDCRYISIVRSDGAMRRDLGFCLGCTITTVGWLPPQVNVSQLPAPLLTPLYPLPHQILNGSAWLYALSWSPDGKQIAGGVYGSYGFDPDKIVIWQIDTGKSTTAFTDVTSDQRIAWTSAEHGTYKPILVSTSSPPGWEKNQIYAVSPDGQQVVTGSGGSITIFQAATHKPIVSSLAFDGDLINQASYSSDGHMLAVGSFDSYAGAEVWDTRTWKLLVTLPFINPAVAFSPDGKYLAVSAGWDVQIYDIEELSGRSLPDF